MALVRISPQAQREIADIRTFIARDNPIRALSFVRELRTRIANIAEMPLRYRERTELRPGLRAARHGNYMIFFKVDGDRVEVLRVRHGATDFGDLFQD